MNNMNTNKIMYIQGAPIKKETRGKCNNFVATVIIVLKFTGRLFQETESICAKFQKSWWTCMDLVTI